MSRSAVFRRRWGRLPPTVLAITATYLVVLLAYSLLVPTYNGPDEPNHVDLTRLVAQDLRYPNWDARNVDPAIIESREIVRFREGSQHLVATEAPPRHERPSIDDLGETIESTRVNQLPQHPPLFYALLGGAKRVIDEAVPGAPLAAFDQEVWLYRLFGLLMIVPLPMIIWATGGRLGLPAPVTTAAMLTPLAIPQLTYMGAVVNNDSLLLLLAWLHAPVVLRIGAGDLRPRTMVLAGVLTGLALLTKGFALVLPIWGVVAIAVGWRRLGCSQRSPEEAPARSPGIAAVQAGAIYGVTALALGGWWWVRNLVVFGQLAPSTEYDRLSAVDGLTPDLGEFVHAWAYRTNLRFWGDFGWRGYDVPLPTVAVAVATLLALLALGSGVRRRPLGVDSVDRLLLLAPWVLFAAFAILNSWRLYTRSGELPLLQGRYWFGGMVGIALLITLGAGAALGRHLRVMPLMALIAAATMQLVALWTILSFYWGPSNGSWTDRLRAIVAWNPLPGELVGVGAAIGAIVVGLTVVLVIRSVMESGGRHESDPEPPQTEPPLPDDWPATQAARSMAPELHVPARASGGS